MGLVDELIDAGVRVWSVPPKEKLGEFIGTKEQGLFVTDTDNAYSLLGWISKEFRDQYVASIKPDRITSWVGFRRSA